MIVNRLVSGVALTLALAVPAAATTITIVNNDSALEGFNDVTLVTNTNAGCNIGETLGACRLRVFQTAADQWEVLLNSPVEILVRSQMDPQTCSGTSAVLGSAGAVSTAANFTNAPRANNSYNIAEANSLAGSDLDPSNPDINATFNITIDAGTCLTGTTGWWYGTNAAVTPPTDRIPLLPVVFHELGHGLGFTSNTNTSSGAYFTSQPPVWTNYLYDVETAKLWKNMTNAERQASAINDPDLVWTGPRTSKQAPKFLGKETVVTVNTPPAIAGNYAAVPAAFGPVVAAAGVTGDVVLVDDGVVGAGSPAGTINDGCETPFVNAAALAGKIALIERGFCNFTVKVKNAQLAGATAVIIADQQAGRLPPMGGADATITIPSYGVAKSTGDSIRANFPVNAKLGYGPNLSGVNSGCVRMFAPNPVQTGSSVSHFHSDANPNLLMEPALNTSIFNKVDLTLPLLRDIDWSINPEDILFIDDFEVNPCQFVQP